MADPVFSQQQITQTSIPDYAKPYVEDLLGNAAGLTDINQNPYMQYMGDRVAQFTPLQRQSYDNAALMQTAPQLKDASAMAGMAGLGALNTQYTYKPSDFSSADATRMMNPYMQNVVDMQKREAGRVSGIQGSQQGAQAAQAGAFGGSRDAIMAAERQRNLGQQMNDIQSTGLNSAYNQAMQQYNTQYQQNAQQQQYGAGLGLQGLQTANQAASNLANIGNTQYQQNMGINQMQNQLGGQQQQQTQNILNTQYQDYLNAQNHPYKQLGFMSDMLRGLPLTQQSSSVYQTPPSMLQQVAGAGFTAKALGAFAGGGSVGERPAGLAELAIYNMG